MSGRRHVAVKQTVAFEDATVARTTPYRLEVAGVRWDGERLAGEVVHGEATVRFDVALRPRDRAPLVHFPRPEMYTGAFPKTKLVSPIVDALAHGNVEIDAPRGGVRRWTVDGWPAMQGHNWGTGHADTYAWGHCNCWHEPEGRELVFEGLSGKVRLVAGVVTPFITVVAVRHRGVRYEAHALSELVRARGGLVRDAGRWVFRFRTRHAGASIEGSMELREDDAVGLYYPNPDGEMTYCLNSKLAHANLRFSVDGRAPLVLTSDAAALEVGTHDASHGVPMYV